MIIEFLATLATVILWLVTLVTTPHRARAPDGWYFEGVRPDGHYVMRRQMPDTANWPGEDPTPSPPGEIYGRIYCTGGARAIVVDFNVVGCQR